MSSRAPDEVFAEHLRLRKEGTLEQDLASNYAADVVLLTEFGAFRGHDGVRACADILRRQMPSTDYAYRVCLVAGEMAFLEWGAVSDRARIEDGADSYLIRDGRIRAQTIHYTVIPHPDGQLPHRDEARRGTGKPADGAIAVGSASPTERDLVSARDAGLPVRR